PTLDLPSFPTRRSSDLVWMRAAMTAALNERQVLFFFHTINALGREALNRLGQQVCEIGHLDSLRLFAAMQNRLFSFDLLPFKARSEEHTSELQSPYDLV